MTDLSGRLVGVTGHGFGHSSDYGFATTGQDYPWGADPYRTPWPALPEVGAPSVVRPVGGEYSPQLIQALTDKLTSQESLLQQAVQELRNQTVSLQANARYLAPAGGSSGAGISGQVSPDIFSSSPDVALDAAEPVLSSRLRQERAAFQRSPADSDVANLKTVQEKIKDQAPDIEYDSPFDTNLTRQGQMEYQTIRQQVAGGLTQRLGNKEWGPQLFQNDNAEWVDEDTGQILGTDWDIEAEAAFGDDTSLRRVQSFQRRDAGVRGAQDFFGRIAEGEGIAGSAQGALGGMGKVGGMNFGGMAKGLGYAGAAYFAADQIKDFAISQRNANAGWQRISGGTNADGFTERARSQLFEMQSSWLGGMGAGQASELYQGSAEIFGTGDRNSRNRAQDFGMDMWRSLGIEVGDSLRLVSEAAEQGNGSLVGLADSLKNVSEAANEAGVSAEVARAGFEQQLQATGQTTGGPTASLLSGVVAEAQAGLGRSFTADAGVSFSGLESEQALRMQAGMQGMTYGEFLSKRETDAAFAGAAAEDYINQNVGNLLRSDPRAIELIEEAQAASPEGLLPGDMNDLANEIEALGTLDPGAVTRILNQFVGSGFTDENSIEAVIGMSTGEDWRLGEKLESRAQESKPFDLKLDENQRSLISDRLGGRAMAGVEGMDDVIGRLKEQAGIDLKGVAGFNDDQRTYLEHLAGGGKANPVIEEMLSSGGFGHNNRYTVETKDGQREVRLDELIRDYSDQAGTAILSRGNPDQMGQVLTDVLGMPEQEKAGASTKEGAKSGWELGRNEGSMFDKEAGAVTGRVEIVPAEELKRLLRMNPSGVAWTQAENRYRGGIDPIPTPQNADSGEGN